MTRSLLHSCVSLALLWVCTPATAIAEPAIAACTQCPAQPDQVLATFTVAAPSPGPHLVRVSLPFPPATLFEGQPLAAHIGDQVVPADTRVLTHYPGQPAAARRAIVTFPYTFADVTPLTVQVHRTAQTQRTVVNLTTDQQAATIDFLGTSPITVTANGISYARDGGTLSLLPAGLSTPTGPARIEFVEQGIHYVWLRLHTAGEEGPRVFDVRADALGTVAISLQIQRAAPGDGYTPAFGWTATGVPLVQQGAALSCTDPNLQLTSPTEAAYGRGKVDFAADGTATYWRCTAEDRVPWQQAAWRSAEIVIGAPGHTPRNALLEPVLDIRVEPRRYLPLYGLSAPAEVSAWPLLAALDAYTRDGIAASAATGDDVGNITSFGPGSPHGGAFGMNRLNHAPAIFEWSWTSGDRRLRDAGISWCLNMHDLSIWWGEGPRHGGTRYNNAVAAGQKEHEGDKSFMWRTNDASTFCTKGFDTFLYAYEETGDPRFAEALHAQVAYGKEHIHVNDGEARNIGDVRDFLTLYRATGQPEYFDEAMRLFRELREVLSTGDLFSQNCKPLEADPPFIDDDAFGYPHPFAKPYIIGYALAGLPELLRLAPDEPKLREVVRAVADFLASSVDPSGGWRYPHPRSSGVIINQGIEHARQICNAAAVLEERGEPIDNLLDAVETVLQARVQGFAHSGAILAGLSGWESTTKSIPEGKTLHDLYKKPEDRDRSRDYTEGGVGVGGSAPEGLVYYQDVLAFYLAHRPAERLFNANPQLRQMLTRVPKSPPAALGTQDAIRAPELPYGMLKDRPAFADAAMQRLTFPLRFQNSGLDFSEWRKTARAAFTASLQAAPPRAPFNAEVIATEDRGTYEARKLRLNLSADNRVTAYLLVPKHDPATRLPAVLALHDHGAHFSIGKEKVIRPFGVENAILQDAQQWVNTSYGGRWFGDELAARGYVVFSTDALFWGERGRAEGVKYEAQETLAANLYQLGRSFSGNIVWDDLRSAEFVQSLPEVDPARIGTMGLSMGAHRTWSLSAATDIVRAGAAICWLGDTATLMAEGNNQTRGQSAHSMTFPGLRNSLDYADVASIACPKPMLFYNGTRDPLFPVPGVEAAYATLRSVYETQGAAAHLETRLWEVPHEFNAAMQDAAFAWLESALKP
jgi:dienelactone hydrolase